MELENGFLFCLGYLDIFLAEFPYKQECITDVLVRTAQMFVDFFVANGSNLVDEDHHISFKNFSGVSEVTNIAETKDSHDLLTRNHHIYDSRILNDSTDNFSSSFTKTYSKKRADLHNSIL